jgi:CheY-like chemotaxis protein
VIKILIVDDEEDVLYSLKHGLESLSNDFSIQMARDGKQCLEILSKETPNLILLDLMMPNMNGWQVLDVIQGNLKWREIPVFIISAFNDPEFKQTTEDLGIPFIEKPINVEELKMRIDEYFLVKKNVHFNKQ